jgi:hypothetical protein
MADEKKKVIDALRETGFFRPKGLYDRGKVLIGLVILAALAAFPFFYDIGRAAKAPEPELNTPAIQALPEPERVCVEPKSYMTDNHMKLLDEWREQAVREDKWAYIGFNGKTYTISLQNTCMGCHSNYDNFCNKCHTYSGITPYCWNCHLNKPQEWAAGKLKEEK